jgi:hypothetical protein
MLATAAMAGNAPPGFRAAESGARHEVAGHSIAVPGKGWLESRTEAGVLFGKRIDATESYHAGLTVAAAPVIADRAAFVAFARQKSTAESGNPRYKVLKIEAAEADRDGLWGVRGRVDFEDSGAVNVGKRDKLLTRGAHLFLFDPREPSRMVTAWFSWRGVEKDEKAFEAEAEVFFASLQQAKQSISK